MLENWYPTAEAGKDKGLLLVVTASKEGAVTGGAGFTGAVGDDLIDSIISTNIPIFTEEEKYNQTVVSAVERLEAKLLGNPVPGELWMAAAERRLWVGSGSGWLR